MRAFLVTCCVLSLCALPVPSDPPTLDDVCGKNIDLANTPITLQKLSDDDLVDCVATLLHPPEHDSNDGAVTNLKKMKGEVVFLMGHGDSGKVCTGKGCKRPDTVLDTATTKNWRKEDKGLTDVGMVVLAGCVIGAGSDAPQLLQQMAEGLGVPVSAPTGMMYCDGETISIQERSTWKCAVPGKALVAVDDRPTKAILVAMTPFTFRTAAGMVQVPRESVRIDTLEVADRERSFHCVELSNARKKEFLSWIDFANPERGTVFGGRVTARFELVLGDGQEKHEETRTFEIFNNAAVMDVADREFHYEVDSRLTDLLDKGLPMLEKPCTP